MAKDDDVVDMDELMEDEELITESEDPEDDTVDDEISPEEDPEDLIIEE